MGCGTLLAAFNLFTSTVFQYPLRAYGVWNPSRTAETPPVLAPFSTLCGPMGCGTTYGTMEKYTVQELSVPSAGLWGVERESQQGCFRLPHCFQYPLRAYGVWNPLV